MVDDGSKDPSSLLKAETAYPHHFLQCQKPPTIFPAIG